MISEESCDTEDWSNCNYVHTFLKFHLLEQILIVIVFSIFKYLGIPCKYMHDILNCIVFALST